MQSLRENGPYRPARAGGHPSRSRQIVPARRPKHSPLIGFLARGVVIAAVAAGGALAFKSGFSILSVGRTADALAVTAGLGVNQIAVTGSRNTLSDDIFAALHLDQPGSLLVYDTAAARSRLETLPWVETAQVTRVLPDGLEITIRERQPFAVWQHKQLMFLVDADGRTLEPAARADHTDLPLVVGDDADAGAHGLMEMLHRFPAVASRLEEAVRVGGRRWDLRLKNAPTLMLPENAPADALVWVERMDREERLFERRLAAIDLRVPGRVVFQLASELPAAGKSNARGPLSPNRGA